jgi:hypothetical protein
MEWSGEDEGRAKRVEAMPVVVVVRKRVKVPTPIGDGIYDSSPVLSSMVPFGKVDD